MSLSYPLDLSSLFLFFFRIAQSDFSSLLSLADKWPPSSPSFSFLSIFFLSPTPFMPSFRSTPATVQLVTCASPRDFPLPVNLPIESSQPHSAACIGRSFNLLSGHFGCHTTPLVASFKKDLTSLHIIWDFHEAKRRWFMTNRLQIRTPFIMSFDSRYIYIYITYVSIKCKCWV